MRPAARAAAQQRRPAPGSRQWAGDGCAPPHPREDRAHKIYRLTLACPQVPEGLLEQPVQDAHSAVVFGQPRPCCCQCCPSPCRAPNEREAVVCRCVDEDELAHHDVLAHVHALVTGAARAVWGEEGYGASARLCAVGPSGWQRRRGRGSLSLSREELQRVVRALVEHVLHHVAQVDAHAQALCAARARARRPSRKPRSSWQSCAPGRAKKQTQTQKRPLPFPLFILARVSGQCEGGGVLRAEILRAHQRGLALRRRWHWHCPRSPRVRPCRDWKGDADGAHVQMRTCAHAHAQIINHSRFIMNAHQQLRRGQPPASSRHGR